MNERKYYDGTKLLSLKDLSGRTPEIFLSTTNRTAGKTTYFSRWCVNKFIDRGEKFGLLFRFNNQLDDVADKFFKDISSLFFPSYHMTAICRADGVYQELFLNNKSCGYAIAMNNADAIKQMSHLFSDIQRIFFDEFQSESNHYCSNEITKFQSIHKSIARGQGKQTRYVPVVMCSNAVTLLNPYYIALGISDRLHDDTKFLKGNGFVLEHSTYQSAIDAAADSGFERAFSASKYQAYAKENVYLNDNMSFIEKLSGKYNYLCNLRFNGKDFSLKEFRDEGVIYCDSSCDLSFPSKIAVTTEDHNINFVMLKTYDMFIERMKYYFMNGAFRFRNLECKQCILAMLSYR